MAQALARTLEEATDRALTALQDLGEKDVTQSERAGGWSAKEELGHLIDSATNNRVRFVRGTLEPEFHGPGYDGDGWVRLQGYREMTWSTLVRIWHSHNELLVHLIGHIPENELETRCTIGSGAPVTLGFVIEDYIRHMQHHLDHILRSGNSGVSA